MRRSLVIARSIFCWCIATLLLPGCIDAYMPDVLSDPKGHLVVDGFINSRGVTTITLTRTYNIQAAAPPPAETQATVRIIDDTGRLYPLVESSKGIYRSGLLTLNLARSYRLRITTAAGQEYESASVLAKTTPVIDNVRGHTNSDGLTIVVNAHDDSNGTRYYRWDYEETWEIIPAFRPQVEYVKQERRFQPIAVPYPIICWGNQKAPDIHLSKTTTLAQDVVADYVLRSYPTTSDRLRYKYSILVKQYALTKEEYDYWTELRKNTEDIGTLFDPLPSQLTGNVRCLSDASELVFGYVGAHTEEAKRIFISRADLPNEWRTATGYEACFPPVLIGRDYASFFSGFLSYVPIYETPEGYISSSKECVDCRLRGSAVKPSFWP
ncbi:protein of unknown function [Hymenobacter daecheongensis DSM 21074]|uniref:DUF4249 domain-containing protein n=1 Tax=Hymenobacter daecheongensis DSM 21074 TaxID=1121955 RepID=A0A1M6AFH1_9BACT|nr:DUF4249 domain-containing protein [Hymenobacter daecheongensis]SHI35157.1 protein of unknown function [Hymenobacter daecheongensis DSM 21074]